MAGLLSSPAAQILSSAINLSSGGTPSRFLDGVRYLFKGEEEEKRSPCSSIASRINGVMKVVKPLIEIKCMIDGARGRSLSPRCSGSKCRHSSRDDKKSPAMKRHMSHKSSERYSRDRKSSCESKHTASKKVDKKSSCNSDKCEKGSRASDACHRSRKRSISGANEEEKTCYICPRSKSLKKLPCGRLICSKCDKSGDHDLELNMPRSNRNSRPENMPNPLAIIDLTQDSPSNRAFRLSSTNSDVIEVVPAEFETDQFLTSNKDQIPKKKKPKLSKPIAVVNLDDTINLEDSLNPSNTTKQKNILKKSTASKEGLTCPICLESFNGQNVKAMTTPCGHVFCLECLTKVTSSKKKCSLCQRSITISKCIRLHI